jgi:pimeloyl-ACP methyl ester carboxylesterase
MTLREGLLKLEGGSVHYLEAGEMHSTTLLLLHGGFGGAMTQWQPSIPYLAEEFHIIAPDLPGFGASERLPALTIAALLDWLQRLLQALGIEQAAVVGSSLSALLARQFAIDHPKIVPAAILVNGGQIPASTPFERLVGSLPLISSIIFRSLSRNMLSDASLSKAVHVQNVLTPAFTEAVRRDQAGLAGLMRALTISPVLDASPIRIPALILWGENDQLTPLAQGKMLAAAIPGAKFYPIANCGHLPQIEEPEVFSWQVRNFLKDLIRIARISP